jgi:hypothetical protein
MVHPENERVDVLLSVVLAYVDVDNENTRVRVFCE